MKSSILALLVFLISPLVPAFSQQRDRIPSQHPRLIITLVVDQMRFEYIQRYWGQYSDEGLKKMVTEGAFCQNASYDYLVNETAVSHATIATGSPPSRHGIISHYWYRHLQEKAVYCSEDEQVSQIGDPDELPSYSPKKLLATSIGDEIKLAGNFRSRVMGIALDETAAVFGAGHTADYAFWYDMSDGRWTSSTYYADSLPRWAREFNAKQLPDNYLERSWEPLLPLTAYQESENDSSDYETGFSGRSVFPYDLGKLSALKRKEKDYRVLKYTPFGHVLTRDFATAAILGEELGQDEFTDFLSIGFSSNEYIGELFGPNSVEIQDAMLRLDLEIAHFLTFIDDYVGLQHTLLILTSDHGLAYSPAYLKGKGIPSGVFEAKAALSLLRSYLNAIYGKGEWVRYYYGQQIYLNRDLIESSGIAFQEIQEKAARFLIQFEGIANAISAHTLQTTTFTEGIFQKIQHGYSQKRSGDVLINLTPGWSPPGAGGAYHSSSAGDNHVPLIWYGWKIRRVNLTRPVKMIDIAPTISYLLEISRPNASEGEILMEIVNGAY